MVTAGKTEAAERLPAMDPEEEISVVITTTAEALDRELVQIIGIIKRQVFSQNQQHRVLQLPRSSKLLELVISLVYCHQFFFFFRFSAFSVSSQSYCPYFILHYFSCCAFSLSLPYLSFIIQSVKFGLCLPLHSSLHYPSCLQGTDKELLFGCTVLLITVKFLLLFIIYFISY